MLLGEVALRVGEGCGGGIRVMGEWRAEFGGIGSGV